MLIGIELAVEMRSALVALLREFKDIFAYSHQDMPGVDPKVVVHSLNIKEGAVPVKQKRRRMNEEKTKASNTKVEKLLKAGFIREVRYPEWVSNVAMVAKKNGSWR